MPFGKVMPNVASHHKPPFDGIVQIVLYKIETLLQAFADEPLKYVDVLCHEKHTQHITLLVYLDGRLVEMYRDEML